MTIKSMARLATLALAGMLALTLANAHPASAAGKTGPREGSGGNSIVCNGVPSRAMLMYYARGGTDSCGHHDIASIWKNQGVTLQVASLMHAGQVCSSQGLQSTGRHHSPSPSLDRPVTVGSTTFYVRPLAVWGSSCYSAWIGTTEDGRLVAVLMGCGNSEVAEEVPVKPKPIPTPHKPKKPKTAPVRIYKIAEDAQGHRLSPTPTGTFRFQRGSSKMTYNSTPQSAGTCTVGKYVTVKELAPLGTEKWKMLTPATQTQKCRAAGISFVFKDREVPPTTTTTPAGTCNITITGGTVNGDITNCSTVTITVICGNVSKTFTGPNAKDAQEQAYSWQQANCTSPQPPPPPVQVCTDKNASNFGGALPCLYPPPPPPVVVQPPMLSNQTNPEEIDADGEHYPNICVTVAGKNGDSITVTFGATFGSFTLSSKTITSTGVDRVCTEYIGPKDSTAVGRNEVITYNAHDNTTGLNAQQVTSLPFPIKAPPTSP